MYMEWRRGNALYRSWNVCVLSRAKREHFMAGRAMTPVRRRERNISAAIKRARCLCTVYSVHHPCMANSSVCSRWLSIIVTHNIQKASNVRRYEDVRWCFYFFCWLFSSIHVDNLVQQPSAVDGFTSLCSLAPVCSLPLTFSLSLW